METEAEWDEMARELSARTDRVRLAVRDGDEIKHVFRSAPWPSSEPDVPLAVYLAREDRFHTLALDIDRGGECGVQQAAALGSLLTRAGVSFIEAVSGPKGHRHLLATWPGGLDPDEVAALARALRDTLAPDLDVTPLMNPKAGCIRPPGALHRSGGRSELVGSQSAALAVLRAGNSAEDFARLQQLVGVPPRAGAPSATTTVSAALSALPMCGDEPHLPRSRRDLSATVEGQCRYGGADGWQDDRSAVAAAVALGMVNAGWGFPEFLAAVGDRRNLGLDHLRTERSAHGRLVPRTDVKGAARRMWRGRIRRALTHPPQSPAPATPPALDEVAAAAGAEPRRWAGQGGPSDRAVLETLLTLARRCGRPVVARDVRSLGLETGLTRSTTARALKRLRRDGWLDLVEVGQGRKASSYRPRVPNPGVRAAGNANDRGGTLAPAPPSLAEQADTLAVFELGVLARAHDAMTSAGLGRYAGLLLDVLPAGPFSPAQLAARSGLNMRTVHRHLRRLGAAGLASPDAGGHWSGHLELLDAAAAALGVAGVVSARRQEAVVERAAWAWWLADFCAERGYASLRGLRRPGQTVMRSGAACPAQPFPADSAGRRVWSAGLAFVQDGLGLTPQELMLVDGRGALPAPQGGPSSPRRGQRLPAAARSGRPRRGGAVMARQALLPLAA